MGQRPLVMCSAVCSAPQSQQSLVDSPQRSMFAPNLLVITYWRLIWSQVYSRMLGRCDAQAFVLPNMKATYPDHFDTIGWLHASDNHVDTSLQLVYTFGKGRTEVEVMHRFQTYNQCHLTQDHVNWIAVLHIHDIYMHAIIISVSEVIAMYHVEYLEHHSKNACCTCST